jgi:hypothetical protein
MFPANRKNTNFTEMNIAGKLRTEKRRALVGEPRSTIFHFEALFFS